MKNKLTILFILLSLISFSQVRITGFNEPEKQTIQRSIELIKVKDEFKYSRFLEFCKEIKYSETGISRTENDSIIIVTKSILDIGSVNKVACSIIHETKRLELRVRKYNLNQKKEEWTCYSSEWGFCCRLECEEWLKHEIQNALVEYQ